MVVVGVAVDVDVDDDVVDNDDSDFVDDFLRCTEMGPS